MKGIYAAVAASAITGAFAAPSKAPLSARAACASPVTLSGNPFKDRGIFANPYYAAEVKEAAAQISDPDLAAKALKVGEVGTFQWM